MSGPDFICIGAQKSGTSWLYHQLNSHPDFWMPPIKELHYFNLLSRIERRNAPRSNDARDRSFMEKIAALSKERHLDLNRYSQLFEAKGNLISGDITPTYASLNDEIIDRIAVHLPHLKVIFLARDPVERAWSQLSMALRHQDIPNFGPNDAEQIMHSLLSPGVILQSYPSKIVARWKRHIPAESFRLYFYDDLQSNPADLRRSILEFLGGDPDKPSGNLRPEYNSHAAFAKVPLTPPMRARIAEFFQRELKASAQELGGAAANWPAKYGFAL